MVCLAQSMEIQVQHPQGQYRTVTVKGHLPRAYVIDRGSASYITEESYRTKGYRPDFAKLPTEDEYHA